MGSAPSRPVVQEMPSNLIGLGEEFAHIQRRQMDGEKKKIDNKKRKKCVGKSNGWAIFFFQYKKFEIFYLSKKNEFHAENGLILINLFQCT